MEIPTTPWEATQSETLVTLGNTTSSQTQCHQTSEEVFVYYRQKKNTRKSQMQVTCRDMPLLTQSRVPKMDFWEEESYRNGTDKKKGMIQPVQDLPREDVLHWK